MNYFHNKSTDLIPNVDPQTWLEKIIQFPIVRMIIVLFLLYTGWLIFGFIRLQINISFDETSALYLGYLLDVCLIATLFFIYRIYTQTVENRKAYEFSFNKWLPELGAGALVAFSAISVYVLINWALGYYKIAEFNSFGNVVFVLFDQLKVGFIEELLFRLIIFKLSEELFGSWAALAIQGIVFGVAHMGNPNATIFTTLALIGAFTFFFGAGYMITRRIWFIFGFHWSWNFFQSGIWGMHNSGKIQPSLITPIIDGPVWITGGEWGAELSLISILILFIVGIYFVKLAKNNNQFINSHWRSQN